ncbi:hypothetical protein HYE67_008449 [Fusarium culmorum]|uniref:Uncharacterized protein n=1 Tax=Fusarium culmorum TaxID=5516 RepID=A0A2T4H8W7_FUSCU|nr:hypothetical protein FCULG_00003145 [Fusarium culmorum]QPC66218.1 hypothetical protein HYE67_008449 [Fusarium culmorum]
MHLSMVYNRKQTLTDGQGIVVSSPPCQRLEPSPWCRPLQEHLPGMVMEFCMPRARAVTNRAAPLHTLFELASKERKSQDAIGRSNGMFQGKNIRILQGSGDNIKARGGNEGDACPKLPIYSIGGLESHLLDRRCFGAEEANTSVERRSLLDPRTVIRFNPLVPGYPQPTLLKQRRPSCQLNATRFRNIFWYSIEWLTCCVCP